MLSAQQAYIKAAEYEYCVPAVTKVIPNRHTLTPDGAGGPAIPPRRSHHFPFDTLHSIKSHILLQ